MSLLRAEEVTVRFGGHTALGEVSLEADAGTITGLIGPNGAGKTTCFNVLSGLQPPDAGRVFFDEEEISNVPAYRRSRLGMARTFQRLEVFGSLTVFENVLVAGEISRRHHDGEAHKERNLRDEANQLVDLVGLRQLADQRVDSIPTGHCRLVELARALATKPKLILLDEPSSGLNEDESEHFGDLILKLAKAGLGIMLVEHDVDLVMRVCSRIHVLDFGQKIAEGTPKEIQRDKAVQQAYLGAETPT